MLRLASTVSLLMLLWLASCIRYDPAADGTSGPPAEKPEPAASAEDRTEHDQAASDDFWNGLDRHEIQLEQTLLLVRGSRGVVACPYLNIETFARTGEACAIVPAPKINDMLGARVTAVTPKALELGIEVGMSGREALERIR